MRRNGAARRYCVLLIVSLAVGALRAVSQGVVVFRESFDSTAGGHLPLGWVSSRQKDPGVDDFQVSASSPRSLPNAVVSTNATVPQFLVSSPIECRGMVPAELLFYCRRSATHGARMLVEASTDGGMTFPVQLGDTIVPSGEISYLPITRGLGGLLAGDSFRLRWRLLPESGGSTGTIRLDDISVTAAPRYDLAIVNLSWSPAVPFGWTPTEVLLQVANRGTEPAGGFLLVVYLDLDRDSSREESEIVARLSWSGVLPPGDSLTLRENFGAPGPGRWDLTADLDYQSDQVPGNNRLGALLQIGAPPFGVVVNEIMYAPEGDEPEWIEVLNTLGTDIDLMDWAVGDAGGVSASGGVSAGCVLRAGAYLVFTRDSAAVADIYPDASECICGLSGFPSLNNSGDAVVLMDPSGRTVDSVVYRSVAAAGRSLERRDASASGVDPLNWGLCVGPGGASPGLPNSIVSLDSDAAVISARAEVSLPGVSSTIVVGVRNDGKAVCCLLWVSLYAVTEESGSPLIGEPVVRSFVGARIDPQDSLTVSLVWSSAPPGVRWMLVRVFAEGDRRFRNDTMSIQVAIPYPDGILRINEIMFAPLAGCSEYIEIVNPGTEPVDIRGWSLSDAAVLPSSSRVFKSRGNECTIRPGGFAVLAADSSIMVSHPFPLDLESGMLWITGESSLGLGNSADCVLLRDPSGKVVDSVAYSSEWHSPDVRDVSGRSLEKIHPTLPSGDSRGWSTCVDRSGGTPGRANSLYAPYGVSEAGLRCSPNPFSPDGDGCDDMTVVSYALPETRGVMNIRIFDVRGRLVRWLANNEPCASQGSLVWDGRNDERRVARLGMYIILLEAWSAAGMSTRLKTVVVVAGRL